MILCKLCFLLYSFLLCLSREKKKRPNSLELILNFFRPWSKEAQNTETDSEAAQKYWYDDVSKKILSLYQYLALLRPISESLSNFVSFVVYI